jgi:DNA repair protein RadC
MGSVAASHSDVRPLREDRGCRGLADRVCDHDQGSELVADSCPSAWHMELRAPGENPSRVQYLASVLESLGVEDHKTTAHQVLERFGSLAAFAAADHVELASALSAIPSLPRALVAAQKIAFAAARERVASTNLEPTSHAFLNYLRLSLGGRKSEVLVAFFANADGTLICERTLAESEGHALQISAAAILRAAVSAGAAHVLLVHNHPSGLAVPSQADRVATQTLIERATALDIRVLDHLIVGGADIYSMQQGRLL